MCYYNAVNISLAKSIRLNAEEKSLEGIASAHQPLISGFDYGLSPVLKKLDSSSGFEMAEMEWGFLPSYLHDREQVYRFRRGYKDEKSVFHPPIITLNAVSEEILLPKKIYRQAALLRRCLVLSTGFYEWRHLHGINRKTGKPLKTALKIPYFIHLPDSEYFFMAGIWQGWEDKDSGEYAETFSILTTSANEIMSQVHNSKKRMPLILPDAEAFSWLMGNLDEHAVAEAVKYRLPSAWMRAYPVAKDFRESADPSAFFDYPDLPSLEDA
jgi:putative SOS response-associated peptidase YedK